MHILMKSLLPNYIQYLAKNIINYNLEEGLQGKKI